MRLLIFACLLVVVYMVDYCHGDEDDIDPFDMVNFDSSNKKMKKKVQVIRILFLILWLGYSKCISGYDIVKW